MDLLEQVPLFIPTERQTERYTCASAADVLAFEDEYNKVIAAKKSK